MTDESVKETVSREEQLIDGGELENIPPERLMRVFTDPVVYPSRGSEAGADTLGYDLIFPQRLALLIEAGDERVDVATWPETTIWLSSLSLAVPLSQNGVMIYGHAFGKTLDQLNIPTQDSAPGSVSSLIPDELPDQLERNLTTIRRKIRQAQDEWFLENMYATVETDLPKSFWMPDDIVDEFPSL